MTNKTDNTQTHLVLGQEELNNLPVNFRFPSVKEVGWFSPYRKERHWPSKFYQNDFSSCHFPVKPISKILDK